MSTEEVKESRLDRESLTTAERLQSLQRKLYLKAKSEPNFRFYMLYDKIYRWDVIKEAWGKVKANHGAPGIDGQTIEDIENADVGSYLNSIQKELVAKTYRPASLRRVYIPKKNGSKRPLGIPTIKDRIVQMALKLVLEPIFEADFEDNSFGYRPKKSAHQAAQEIRKHLNYGYTEVIDCDISDCFGSIQHAELLNMIARRVVDGKILHLIKMFLKAGVMQQEQGQNDKGTPQGGVISPLLANVYLDRLDKGWKVRYSPVAKMIRYADDIVILTKDKARIASVMLKRMLKDMKLNLNEAKTKVVNAQESTFDFLGFSFKKAYSKRRRRLVALFWPSHQAEMSIRHKVKAITNFHRPVKVEQIIQELNPALRGWVNYHRVANAAKKFKRVRQYAECRIKRFIRRRGKKRGLGYYRDIPQVYLYKELGLFNDYRLSWMKAFDERLSESRVRENLMHGLMRRGWKQDKQL